MEKILLIDDEEGIRKVLRIILTEAGFGVICAASGEEGLDLFKKESPSVVITDIRMPGLDGLELLKAVKELDREVEVIVITGHGEMDLAIQALKLQASDFIHKPIGNDAILVAVERALDRIEVKRTLRAYTEDLQKKVQEATEELRRVNAFQTNLIQSSIDGIVATDRDGTIVVFNRSAQRLSQYAEQEVLGTKRVFDLFPPAISRQIQRFLQTKAHSGESPPILQLSAQLRSKETGQIPVRLSGTLLHDDGRVMGSVWSIEDLQEVSRLQQRLIQNERMAAMGETVAGMAHAVKNILGSLKGGTFVVDKGLELSRDDLVRQGWDMVRRNISKIQELVMDLLSFAKERQPELEPCDPNGLVSEVVDLMTVAAQQYGVQLSCREGKLSSTPLLDRKWMHRCLTNLVGNAIDACIETFGLTGQGKVVLSAYHGPSGRICFEVSDNGCGMDEEVICRLFSSFFTTKGSRGTGLGLMLTQKMVREHGGRIEVDSTLGKGSRFKIILPWIDDASDSEFIQSAEFNHRDLQDETEGSAETLGSHDDLNETRRDR